MPAFIVYVNSNKVCSVALTEENTRTIDIMWVGNPNTDEGDLICFHIGGPDGNEHVRWSVPQLKVGDEVTIRITEALVADPPTSRKTVEQMDREARGG